MEAPRFVLPGSWARIPLQPEAATLAAIRKLTEQVTGRKDELATTRAELRARFRRAAEVAREGGASELYIGLELVPGIPLPAWAAVFPADPEAADLGALGFGDLTKAVDFAVGAAPEDGATTTQTDDSGRMHAVRHAWRRKSDVAEGEVQHTFDVLEVDYWILAADPNRLALVTFSTALAEYEEEMLDLFDAVVNTMRWPTPAVES
jgi:hypothetical protein